MALFSTSFQPDLPAEYILDHRSMDLEGLRARLAAWEIGLIEPEAGRIALDFWREMAHGHPVYTQDFIWSPGLNRMEAIQAIFCGAPFLCFCHYGRNLFHELKLDGPSLLPFMEELADLLVLANRSRPWDIFLLQPDSRRFLSYRDEVLGTFVGNFPFYEGNQALPLPEKWKLDLNLLAIPALQAALRRFKPGDNFRYVVFPALQTAIFSAHAQGNEADLKILYQGFEAGLELSQKNEWDIIELYEPLLAQAFQGQEPWSKDIYRYLPYSGSQIDPMSWRPEDVRTIEMEWRTIYYSQKTLK